jgi:hypothetical protein
LFEYFDVPSCGERAPHAQEGITTIADDVRGLAGEWDGINVGGSTIIADDVGHDTGLADEWDAVKEAYAAANRALGCIVKVTPSSKVVGDLANFMVTNSLNEHTLVERAGELSFPKSVVEFMQGYLGQPPGGFPEPLRSRIMKNAKGIDGRPGASIPALNMVALRARLQVRPNHWFVKPARDDNRQVALEYPQVCSSAPVRTLPSASSVPVYVSWDFRLGLVLHWQSSTAFLFTASSSHTACAHGMNGCSGAACHAHAMTTSIPHACAARPLR